MRRGRRGMGEGGMGAGGGEGGRVEFKANSRFAVDCLRFGGLGVRPSCVVRRALEGGGGSGARLGMAEGSVAWERKGALGANLEPPHTVFGYCVGCRGSEVQLRFREYLES